MDDSHLFDRLSSAASSLIYTISGGLVFGDWMQYLDAHAGAFGIILGVITYLTNLYFKKVHEDIYAKSLEKK